MVFVVVGLHLSSVPRSLRGRVGSSCAAAGIDPLEQTFSQAQVRRTNLENGTRPPVNSSDIHRGLACEIITDDGMNQLDTFIAPSSQ